MWQGLWRKLQGIVQKSGETQSFSQWNAGVPFEKQLLKPPVVREKRGSSQWAAESEAEDGGELAEKPEKSQYSHTFNGGKGDEPVSTLQWEVLPGALRGERAGESPDEIAKNAGNAVSGEGIEEILSFSRGFLFFEGIFPHM